MMILDDPHEEVTEERLETVRRWFNKLPKMQCSVYQGKHHKRTLLELIKEANDGND